ncbi:MAG: hypothetical protein M3R17_00365 [Bacteroidota bacterium]|nr:hypothetical protein [Bacteroidota bacterium]
MYAAGTVSGTGGTDWEIISYSPDGTSRWTMTLNGAGSGADAAIAVDSAFNIYVCGYTVNSSSNEDITVRKIDSSGAAYPPSEPHLA